MSVGACFVLLGHVVAQSAAARRLVRHPLAGLVLTVALYESVVLLGAKPLSMAWSEYPAGFWRHTLAALLAILAVLNLCSLIARAGCANALTVVGRHSKSIMSHHLFVFTAINLVLAGLGIAALKDVAIWYSWMPQVTWPAYAALAVGLPILLDAGFRRLAPGERLLRWVGKGRTAFPLGDGWLGRALRQVGNRKSDASRVPAGTPRMVTSATTTTAGAGTPSS